MTKWPDKDNPVLFLGIAGFLDTPEVPFPFGGVDLYQLSQYKTYIVYPATVASNEWVFLVGGEFFKSCDLSKWEIRIMVF